jgi:hypothetical protein
MAHIYYTLRADQKKTPIPTISFTNINTYANMDSYDYALFRYSIFVQTAHNNNEPVPTNSAGITNFSKYSIGQIQIYPTAFENCDSSHAFLLTNEIEGNTNYQIQSGLNYAPNGRLFYTTGIINQGLTNILQLRCSNSNNESKLLFDFSKMTEQLDTEINIIYSIEIELLNPGKVPVNSIKTENFDVNI